MLSRRSFLLGSCGLLLSSASPTAVAARHHAPLAVQKGFRSIARISWPPAISPNSVQFIDHGYSIFSDEVGNLAIVDLRHTNGAHVVGELLGIGSRIIDFKIQGHHAYALTFDDESSGDTQYSLVIISLAPFDEPTVVGHTALTQFAEPTNLAVGPDLICIAGSTYKNENIIAFYLPSGKKSRDPILTNQATLTHPAGSMQLQGHVLSVLTYEHPGQLLLFDVLDSKNPTQLKSLDLDGEYSTFALSGNLALVGGRSREGKLISLAPTIKLVSTVTFEGISNVTDIAATKDLFLVLGEDISQRKLLSLPIKNKTITGIEQALSLPTPQETPGLVSRFAVKDRLLNIVSGQNDVQVFTASGTNWDHAFDYSIPRLAASSLAGYENRVILGGADLSLYDISKPEQPTLIQKVVTGSTVKSIAAAGTYLLSLQKDGLYLRKVDSLPNPITMASISGQQLAYDTTNQRAFVLNHSDKGSIVTPYMVHSNSLDVKTPLEIQGSFNRISASNGFLAVTGLNEVQLYRMDDSLVLVGSKHFEGQAIRDIVLAEKYILLAAVDNSGRGFFIVLSTQSQDSTLSILGSCELPNDAAAIAATTNLALVVGRNTEGKGLATRVSFHTASTPSTDGSTAIMDSATAVTINGKLAMVAGRGLEILSWN